MTLPSFTDCEFATAKLLLAGSETTQKVGRTNTFGLGFVGRIAVTSLDGQTARPGYFGLGSNAAVLILRPQ